jgi:uncharacterized membrane protein
MLPANMAASSYVEPHADWFRVFSSLAAPTFILASGMMVAFGAASKRHSWEHFVLRGGLLLLTAALVDALIWKLVPFRSFDVLYLLGLACPLTYFVCRIGRRWQLAAVMIAILAAPILQKVFGYADCPSDIYLWGTNKGELMAKAIHPTGVAHHLFVDGWFPLFPWLRVSFSGVLVAQYFFLSSPNRRYPQLIVASSVLLLLGIPLWLADPGPHYVRAGYSEMFYPPTVGFIITAIGFATSALWVARWQVKSPVCVPLRWLGEASLFMYVLHFAIIAFVIAPQLSPKPLKPFLILNFSTLAVLVLVAASLHRLKRFWPNRAFLFKFFFGG